MVGKLCLKNERTSIRRTYHFVFFHSLLTVTITDIKFLFFQ